MDWSSSGSTRAASTRGEELLGSGLARIHAAGAPGFGALPPGAPDVALRFGG